MPVPQELEAAVGGQESLVARVNAAGEEIAQQSRPDDSHKIKEQLSVLNKRWEDVRRRLAERKRRCVMASALCICVCCTILRQSACVMPEYFVCYTVVVFVCVFWE